MNTGEVTSIVGDQLVVKSTSKPPQIGTTVYSGKGKIGIVSDVIGLVDKPYFIVKPDPKAKINVNDRLRSD